MTTMARAFSIALVGLDGQVVEVEAALGGGLPRTVLVGLPDTALYEARDRCRAAVNSAGLGWPQHLVTINLSPAALPKAGSHYDIAIVAAVLTAAGTVSGAGLDTTVFIGEVGLDGRVRAVRGVLSAVLAAQQHDFSRVVVPVSMADEARLVEGMSVQPIETLADLADVLNGKPVLVAAGTADRVEAEQVRPKDLSEVVGQLDARWALEIAAAGRHHLWFTGPPGVGKTLLAERLPGILPPLTAAEALEVSAIHSLAGLSLEGSLVTRPPYSAPHHLTSMVSLVGGGPRMAKPGLISVAHKGVLFLDEAPEFSPRMLDTLRTPLESGEVTIGRAQVQARFPANFQLVLASNPCPCGLAATPGADCTCAPMSIRRYGERLSGPIRDRIDITQPLRPIRKSFLQETLQSAESSATVAARVAQARERQAHRLAGTGWTTNAEVRGSHLRNWLPLPEGLDHVDQAVSRGRLSARGVDRVLRLAWTIADLGGRDRPSEQDLLAALAMRRGESDFVGRVA